MSMNSLNDISKLYIKEVLKPQIGDPSSKGGEQKRGSTDEESSAKRIRQAVYDIRYRAKEKNLELPQAYSQYIGGSQMSSDEKAAVKEKLGLSESLVSEEEEKYSVRIVDKEGNTKYEKKTRSQISALRADPTISSVEMSKSGGAPGKLDPVGQEDKDIDNDGDHDKTDKYLMKRRKAIGKAIATRKEGFENEFYSWRDSFEDIESINEWKNSLIEVLKNDEDRDQKIKEKSNIKNKVRVNPVVGESLEEPDNIIIESVEDASIFSDILDVDFYHMSEDLLEAILHEFYDECIVEGLDLLEVRKEIVRTLQFECEILEEATVTVGHDTKEKEAVKGIKKDKMGTLKSLAKKAYNISPKKVVDKSKQAYSSEKGQRIRKGIKKGLKKIGKRLSKTADNIAGRMFSEQGPGQDSGAMNSRKRESDMNQTQDDTRRKQSLNAKERLMKRQQLLDRQRLQMQKQGKIPTSRMESTVPGKPAEKVGALTNIDIPKSERDAARERLLSKAKAKREKMKEEVEQIDEVSAQLALTASQKADEQRRKAAAAGDKETAMKKAAQASRLYKGVGSRRTKERMKEDLQINEMPYQVMGSPTGGKEKKIGKPVKSAKYADARAAELADTHKKTGGKYRSQYVEDIEQVDEKMNLKKADMGDVVKDFYKSDAPQFKGKTKKERQKMAIAAKLSAERGGRKLGEENELDERTRYAKETGKDPQTGKPSVKGGEGRSEVGKMMQRMTRPTGGAMGSRGRAIQPQGKKKERGAKDYQGQTPVDKIRKKLAQKRAPKPDIGSRFD